MLCSKPVTVAGSFVYGCGQCANCRHNRRRIWSTRIMLEANLHESNAFVTLTYDDEWLPADGSVMPSDVQLWLKRLRSRVSPSKVRYFLVGEYGDITWRPHYHAALFGFQSCCYGESRYAEGRGSCCHWCDLVRETWGMGNVHLGTLEASSAGYICGYVSKKMTRFDDDRLYGRHPEFARMSLRPGIGRDAMWDMADVLMRYKLDTKLVDVPSVIGVGKSQAVIGRYLRVWLRKMCGKDGRTPDAVLAELAEKMRSLQLAARASSDAPSVASQVLLENAGRRANAEGRRRIYKQGRSL